MKERFQVTYGFEFLQGEEWTGNFRTYNKEEGWKYFILKLKTYKGTPFQKEEEKELQTAFDKTGFVKYVGFNNEKNMSFWISFMSIY